MRILFVALKYDYGIPSRGYSFEYYNFYDSLVGMGHEVEYFDFMSLFQEFGREEMTRMLRRRVDESRPDLMFALLFSDQFDQETLAKITRETSTVTFNWFADDHWRFDDFSRHWAPCFRFVSTTDARSVERYRAIGYRNVLLTQWAANPRLYRKADLPQRYDVSFVGQGYGDRPAILRELKRQRIPVVTFGTHWHLRRWHRGLRKLRLMSPASFQRVIDATRISQEEMITVFQASRINLNLSSSSAQGDNQIKGRNFEIPACGAFQLSGYAERLEKFFDIGKEIVCYRTIEELAEKARFYLDHEQERQAIAQAGHQRVLREHTYQHRFSKLFSAMGLR